jgi:hypothetical protein
MLGVEELQNDDYTNKYFETAFRQMTTQETSDKGQYRKIMKDQHRANISLNVSQHLWID